MDSNKFAIFLDIDGTLYSHGTIPQKNIDTISYIRKLGHKVFINTGRSLGCIPKYVLGAVELDGLVAGIGSYVQLGREIIQCVTIPCDLLTKITDYYLSTGRTCVYEGVDRLYFSCIEEEKDKPIIRKSSDFVSIYNDIRISKVTAYGQLSDSDKEVLGDDFIIYQHESYYEFGLKGHSKSSGMKVMLDRLNLKRENCIAMGDSLNDIDMLQYAGISVAMQNAPDEVKQICDFVTDYAENAGVALALEKIILADTESEAL